MCGIIGFKTGSNIRVNKLKKRMRAIFENQKSRGQQGGGVYIQGETNELFRSTSPEDAIKVLFDKISNNKIKTGDLILFHHRIPTCTSNKPEYNHPLKYGRVTVVHNGWISNASELCNLDSYNTKIQTWEPEKGVSKNGKQYYTMTDSELISIILDESISTIDKEVMITDINVLESLRHLASKVKGNFAIAFTIEGSDKIWLFKTTNPLVIYDDNHGNHYFSSQYPDKSSEGKHLDAFKNEYELKEGEYGYIGDKGFVSCGDIGKEFIDKMSTYRSTYYSKSDALSDWDKKKNSNDYYGYDWDNEYNEDIVDVRNTPRPKGSKTKRYNENITELYSSLPIFDKLAYTPFDDLMKFKKECEIESWHTFFKNETVALKKQVGLKEFLITELKENNHPTKNSMMGKMVTGIISLQKKYPALTGELFGELLKVMRPVVHEGFDDLVYENQFLFRLSNLMKLKIDSFELAMKMFMDKYGAENMEEAYTLYEIFCDYENLYITERNNFVENAKELEQKYYGFTMEEYKKQMETRIKETNQLKLINLLKDEDGIKMEVINLDHEDDSLALSKLFSGCNSDYVGMLQKNYSN